MATMLHRTVNPASTSALSAPILRPAVHAQRVRPGTGARSAILCSVAAPQAPSAPEIFARIVEGPLRAEQPAVVAVDSGEDFTPITEPKPDVLQTWMTADAVCFDVDCTVTVNDSLDLLAEFMGVKEEVEALTNQAMDGSMSLEVSLEERLRIINCTPDDVKLFLRAHPPSSRFAPGIEGLIKALQARGKSIYLISGGFRELILPIAAHLGIPKENVYANRMQWQWDDETGAPTSLAGFDPNQPTSRNNGKVEAIAQIRAQNPYNTVVMIGDGITDLEAVQATQGADLFIGYGGVVERPAVARGSQWFVRDFDVLAKSLKRLKVAMVGSGAWACATVRMLAQNTLLDDPAQEFVDEVSLWVHESEYEGRPLTEVINETHENPKYMPGVGLGTNVVATPDLTKAVEGADVIVLCVAHQYMRQTVKKLAGKVKPGAIAVSLAKGMDVRPEGPQLISQMVRRILGIDCSVLMGANIAADIANEQYSEAVIGYSAVENAEVLRKLFQRPYFKINLLPDLTGAEMCGTLKNIVALGAGIVDGLGLGANSKSIVIKQGLAEMRGFSKALYPQVRDETFAECCGIGDLIATCYGGRNRLVAEEWTRRHQAGDPATFSELESELLKGQKLQGVLTSDEVQVILRLRGWEKDYPLFTAINRIIHGQLDPAHIFMAAEGKLLEEPASGAGVLSRDFA